MNQKNLAMPLRAHFKKAVVAGFAALAIAGCSNSFSIGGAKAKGPLRGQRTTEVLPQSGAAVTRVTIDSSALKAGAKYHFNNVSVRIEGDLPARVTIKGTGGQLFVTGAAGTGDKINIDVPEYSHIVPQTCTGMQPVFTGYTMETIGKTEEEIPNYIYVPYTYDCPQTVDDGPKPPFNKDPAIIIQGGTGKNVKLTGSKGITYSTGF